MIQKINIEDYFNLKGNMPLIDIRTPSEYQKGHIPNAINLPIFSNEERVKIGTTYKKIGREQAILLGFDVVGTKWRGFIEASLKIAPNKTAFSLKNLKIFPNQLYATRHLTLVHVLFLKENYSFVGYLSDEKQDL